MKKLTLKRLVDWLMLICLILSLATPIKQSLIHEWISIILLILVLIHLYLNLNWFKTIKKNFGNNFSIALSVVNILLIIAFIFTALSGITLSRNVLGFLNIFPVSLARRIHVAMPYWFMVLAGIHVGFNWNRFIPQKYLESFSKSKLKPYILTIAFAIALYGAWIFNTEEIASYMFFIKPFVDSKIYSNTLLALFNGFSIFELWVFLGIQISKFLKQKRS